MGLNPFFKENHFLRGSELIIECAEAVKETHVSGASSQDGANLCIFDSVGPPATCLMSKELRSSQMRDLSRIEKVKDAADKISRAKLPSKVRRTSN